MRPLLRILVLGDGPDAESAQPPGQVVQRLLRAGIALDAVMRGCAVERDRRLHTLA